MRNRVLLHKLKFNADNELDKSPYNSYNVSIAHLDMSSAVANRDYWSRQTVTSTFRGQSVRIIRFDMSWAGYGRTHCNDFNQATELNKLLWEVKLNASTNRYEFAGFSEHYKPIEIGVKPDDWDTSWQWKYYTKYDTNFYWSGSNYVPVTYPRGISNSSNDTTPYTNWDNATQYYKADDEWEINQIWITERMLSFGGWLSFETYGTGNNSAYMCGFVNGYRSLGVRLYADGSNLTNWQYTGGRVGFAQLSTDTNRLTNFIGTMHPSSPSGGHVNTYRSNVPFVEDVARTKLINEGKWSIKTFCRLVAFTMDNVNYIGYLMGYSNPNHADEPYLPIIYAIEDLADESLSPWGIEPPPSSDYRGHITTPTGGNGTYTDPAGRTDVTGVPPDGGTAYMTTRRTYKTDATSVGLFITDMSGGGDIDLFTKRLDGGIIDCYKLPIEVTETTIAAENFSVLGFQDTFGSPVITSECSFLDCGSVLFPRYYNTFADFAPYQSATIHIPFVGDFELPINDVVGQNVRLKYRQDNQTGDLVAFVFSDPQDLPPTATPDKDYYHCIGAYPSNAKYSVSLSTTSKNLERIASGVSAFKDLGMGVVRMVAGDKLGGALQTGRGIFEASKTYQQPPLNEHRHTQLSGSSAWLGIDTPYILVTRSIITLPETYSHDLGYVCLSSARIGDCEGFTAVRNADVKTITRANEAEQNEILRMLISGIYV